MSEGGHVSWGKRLLKWDWALGVPLFQSKPNEGNNSCGPVDAGCTLSSLCLLHFQVAILQGGTITFLNVMDGSMEYRDMKGSKDI